MNRFFENSITLVELLVAIALIAILILAIYNLETYSRVHLMTSARHVQVQNETSIALEHMSKQISQAIGDSSNWPVLAYSDDKGIRIRIDSNKNGILDPATDEWVAYRHIDLPVDAAIYTDSELRFYSNDDGDDVPPLPTAGERIAHRFRLTNDNGVKFSSDVVGDSSAWPANELTDNVLIVEVDACWDPGQSQHACGTIDNPEAKMQIRIFMPSVSLN